MFHYTITELPDRELDEAGRTEAFTLWASRFPAADDRLSREIALTLTYTQHAQAAATILAAMPQGDEKREVQLHYLYALRTVATGWTPALQQQLGAVFERTTRWRGGIGGAVNTMFDQTMERFPESERANVYKSAPTLAPLPVVAAAAAPAPGAGGRGAAAVEVAEAAAEAAEGLGRTSRRRSSASSTGPGWPGRCRPTVRVWGSRAVRWCHRHRGTGRPRL